VRYRARDNPFSSERIESVPYILQDTTWPQLLARLGDMNYRAAIVGPKGHGKTTLLESLGRQLESQGIPTRMVGLTGKHHRVPWKLSFPSNHIVLVDGAEQLSRLAWLRVRLAARRCKGLIVTSHRAGMLPTLMECRTSRQLLADVVGQLFSGQCAIEMEDLFARHAGNCREALRELYDRAACG